VMMFAPFGVGAAMAHTIGTQGLRVLVNLGNLVLSLYLALIIFIVLIFGLVIFIVRVPLRQFFRAVREPAALAFATTSSESALPKAMQVMERIGVPKHIVGFVMPTGYSFNLDGSTLYLAMASVFVAQAAEATTGQHMGWDRQIMMMLALMITSKGVAAVPRASLVVLLATLNSFLPAGLGPIGVAVIFGVDELMDMGRTCVNLRRIRRQTSTRVRHHSGSRDGPKVRRSCLRRCGRSRRLRTVLSSVRRAAASYDH